MWAAESLGLSLIKPYLLVKSVTSIEKGVNFAVAGATTLDIDFFIERGIYSVSTNFSLRVQLDWFTEILPYLCNTSSSKYTIQSSSSLTFFLLFSKFLFSYQFPEPGNQYLSLSLIVLAAFLSFEK